MKKNKLFILGLVTVFVALVSLTLVSSTWAKYTTTASGSDTARVAYWGFNKTGNIELEGLFKNVYDASVNSTTSVIAPGTTNNKDFTFTYTDNGSITKPEVDYHFIVSVNGSVIDQKIEENKNILWSLNGVEFAHDVDGSGNITKSSWDKLMEAILALAGTDPALDLDPAADTAKFKYEAGTLPAAFTSADFTHNIAWRWAFDETVLGFSNNDAYDTSMGNAGTLDEVTISISITATQID